MKKTLTSLIGVVLLISILFVAVTANDYKKKEGTGQGNSEQEKLVTIGFSQVGAESNWRTANSVSYTHLEQRADTKRFSTATVKMVLHGRN